MILLSKPFHDQIHDFMRERGYQVSTRKIKAGYKFPGVPDLGNTMESRKNALLHFFKNVQEPIERKLNTIKWDQEQSITMSDLSWVPTVPSFMAYRHVFFSEIFHLTWLCSLQP